MNFAKVGQGHRIAGAAALLLLVDLFMTWYTLNEEVTGTAGQTGGFDTSFSAWQTLDFTRLVVLATVLVALAAVAQAGGLLKAPKRLSDILLPLAVVSTLLVLYRILNSPEDNELLDVSFGAYLGLLLSAALAYGAHRARGEHEEVGPSEVAGKPLGVETRSGGSPVGGEARRTQQSERSEPVDPPRPADQPAMPIPPPAVPSARAETERDEDPPAPPPPSTGP